VSDLLLLPGLGADERLFKPQADGLPGGLWVPRCPSFEPTDTLGSFAKRLADAFPARIPQVIGGSSFGGMAALELAAILRPKAVVLIGSCTTPAAIRPFFRIAGRTASRLPVALFEPRPWLSPFLFDELRRLNPSDRRLFWEMARGVPPSFLKWGCGAILSWRPAAHDVPVFHLHGASDRIIPVGRVAPTEIVPGGGHLLSLSHPAATTDFLARVVSSAR
jgi:pimeloyl-ACP methyl ester carboxylesterase